jgi:predicted transcriptional regulator
MADIQLLQIKDVMTHRPARIRHDANVHRAAEIVGLSRASDLMVVDNDGNFIGVLSEGDILRTALPDIDEILDEGGSLNTAYNIFLDKGKNLADLPITPLVIQEPIIVDPDDHVAKATTVLVDRQIRLLPVVKDGKLVGTVSRADVCQAVVGTL